MFLLRASKTSWGYLYWDRSISRSPNSDFRYGGGSDFPHSIHYPSPWGHWNWELGLRWVFDSSYLLCDILFLTSSFFPDPLDLLLFRNSPSSCFSFPSRTIRMNRISLQSLVWICAPPAHSTYVPFLIYPHNEVHDRSRCSVHHLHL